jgi:hypothetical protein
MLSLFVDCLFSYAEVERTAWVEAFAEGTTTTTAMSDESLLDSRKRKRKQGRRISQFGKKEG